MKSIIIIGYMGAGKTTVGKALGIPNIPKFYIGPVLSINMF